MLNGSSSDWAEVESGVPQGSVLGPLLFIIFINDIGEGLKGFLYIFADDTKQVHPVDSREDADRLQAEIDKLYEWSIKWSMKFNSSKCAVMHIGRRNECHSYTLGTSSLATTKAERDVGVIIQDNLKFDQQVKKVVNTCNRIIGQVSRSFQSKDPELMMNIYQTYILPHVDYAISVWYPHFKKDIELLESVQRRFTRLIAGMKGLTYEERLATLGLPTLEERRIKIDLIQAYKILNNIDKTEGKMFTKVSERTLRTTRSTVKENFAPERTSLDQRRFFFSNRVASAWNSLPKTVQMAKNLPTFKHMLKTILF